MERLKILFSFLEAGNKKNRINDAVFLFQDITRNPMHDINTNKNFAPFNFSHNISGELGLKPRVKFKRYFSG